jgi:uncharacterized protein YeaO (DUF488 family)
MHAGQGLRLDGEFRMKKAAAFRIKRIYEAPSPDDGFRVLVDRLWPRGVSKEKAAVDLWLKDATPSNALRQWIHADPAPWPEFRRRYFAELDAQPEAIATLKQTAANGPVTLLTAARDEAQNHVLVLMDYLQGAIT